MKFCLVYDNLMSGFAGHEYEPYYRMSEYTSGGACYNYTGRLTKEDLFSDEDNEGRRVFIFENDAAANKWIKDYGDHISRFKVINLSDIEKL